MASSRRGLTVDYSAPSTASRSFSQTLPACAQTPSTEERTAYLASLHASIGKMQDEVNAFLTQKMEEDKMSAGNAAQTADEAKEEENYGEEVVEDEG